METEHLSIDSAVDAILNSPGFADDDNPSPETGADTATHETNTDSGQDDPDLDLDFEDAGESSSGDEVDEGDGSEEVDESPPIQAPELWDSEDKAAFAQLGREAQQLMLKHDERRNKFVETKLNEAANSRRQADAEAQRLTKANQALDQIVPLIERQFKTKWANVDWAAWQQQDPIAAANGRIQAEQEYQTLHGLVQTQVAARDQENAQHRQAQVFKMQELASTNATAAKLMHKETGAKARKEVEDYLVSMGVHPDNVQNAKAEEWLISHDAMMYRRAMERSAAKKPQAKPAPSAGMRSAASPAKSIQSSAIDTQKRRFAQTGKIDDLVNLMVMADTQQRPAKRPK